MGKPELTASVCRVFAVSSLNRLSVPYAIKRPV